MLALVMAPAFVVAAAAEGSSPDAAPMQPPRVWSIQELIITYGLPEAPPVRESVDVGTRQASRSGGFAFRTLTGQATMSLSASFQLPARVVEGEPAPMGISAFGTAASSGVGESTYAVQGDFSMRNGVEAGCAQPQAQNERGIGNRSHTFTGQHTCNVTARGIDRWTYKMNAFVSVSEPGPGWVGTHLDSVGITVEAVYALGYNLALEVDPPEVQPSPRGGPPATARLTATVRDAQDRPVAGDSVRFALGTPGLGRLATTQGTTDGQGRVSVVYEAPTADQIGERTGVDVWATNESHRGSDRVTIQFARYTLNITADPMELPVSSQVAESTLTVTAFDPRSRPAAGDRLEFRLEPSDLGSIEPLEATTDSGGRAVLRYTAPTPERLMRRSHATVYVRNVTHPSEAEILLRLKGMEVVATDPKQAKRDVDWEALRVVALTFSKRPNPVTVTRDTVRLTTESHGNLGAELEVRGHDVLIRLTDQPVPDVGLVVTVDVKDGPDGVRGDDGAPLMVPFTLRFRTAPKLHPKIVVSQIIDDPVDARREEPALLPRPFIVRVEAGIPVESELPDEKVSVKLVGPYEGEERSSEHTYYPGVWPPSVPDDAAATGNSANFRFAAPVGDGPYAFRAELRPLDAVEDKTQTVYVGPIKPMQFRSAQLNGRPLDARIMTVPIVSDRIPPSTWHGFEGATTSVAQWSADMRARVPDLVPLSHLTFKSHANVFTDVTCSRGILHWCLDGEPWTHLRYWTRQIGRSGWQAQTSYIVGLVPPGFFESMRLHPDVVARPDNYHFMLENRVFFTDFSGTAPGERYSPYEASLVDVSAPPEAFAHALGDSDPLLSHSLAPQDPLAGYDMRRDRVIRSDGTRAIGASRSIMNHRFGGGASWTSRTMYLGFLWRWTSREFGGGRVRLQQDAPEDPLPVPVIGVSGAVRINGTQREAEVQPLVFFEGVPTLEVGAGGPSGPRDVALELRDASGATLGRFPLPLAFTPSSAGDLADFMAVVPHLAGTSEVALVLGTETVAAVVQSDTSPDVEFVRPTRGGSQRGVLEIAWRASDADGDPLTYTLLMSADETLTWTPLVIDGSELQYTLDTTGVPNAADVRFKLVASDGFHATAVTTTLSLDNPPAVVATFPRDGETGVWPLTTISADLRDPLDPATLHAGSFAVHDSEGNQVPGALDVVPGDSTVTFRPEQALRDATRYWVRVTPGLRAVDGRSLAETYAWSFVTRGPVALYLPQLDTGDGGAPGEPSSTASVTAPPTATQGPSSTPTPSRTAAASSTPSPTVDAVGTMVAGTLTAMAPTAEGSPTPSSTVDVVGTAVAATLTAVAPTPTATVTGQPSATPTPGVSIWAVNSTTTGPDATHMQMAFAAGEELSMWLYVENLLPQAATARFEWAVVGEGGFAPPELAWSGDLSVEPGRSWLQLQRTVPASAPTGAYQFLGTVTMQGVSTTSSSDFYIAGPLQFADGFADARHNWPSGDTADNLYGYLDGAYRALVKTANRWIVLWPTAPAQGQVAVEADVSFTSGESGAAGLMADRSPDGQSFVVFIVDRQGQYSLSRRSGGTWQTVVPWTASPSIDSAGVTHLMLVRRGSELRLFAENRSLATVDDGPAGSAAGVYVEANLGQLDARFDAFRRYTSGR